ncbi:hypothetical protein [Asticcacaulis benevestitus]|nr:hypothetical protein [Asticcacaulis benevestitus]
MKKLFGTALLALALALPLSVMAQDHPAPDSAAADDAPVIVLQVTEAANLRALADKAGYDGHSAASYAFVVPQDKNVMGKQGGGTAIDTGEWPENAFIALVVKGHVYGGGGNGADGGDTPMVRDGGRGGDAIYVRAPLAIVIQPKGSIKAGGGGGAGADGIGSGGGGGFPNGKGGDGGSALQGDGGIIVAGNRGYYGTPGGGGKGGQRGTPGGDGGNAGQAGQSLSRMGGGEGFAIRTDENPVTLDNKGQLVGQAG